MVKPYNPNTRMLFALAKALRHVSASFVEPDDILDAVIFDSIWPDFSWWHQNVPKADHVAEERLIAAIKSYGTEMMNPRRINLHHDVEVARLEFAGISPRCGLPSTKSVRTLLEAYVECARKSRGHRRGFREISPRKRWSIVYRLNRCKYTRTSIKIADRYFRRRDLLPPSIYEPLDRPRQRRQAQFIRVHNAFALSRDLKAIREMKAIGASEGLTTSMIERAWFDSVHELGVPCADAYLP